MKVIHINSDYGNTIYKKLSVELFKLNIEQRVFMFVRPNNTPTNPYDDFVDVRVNYKNFDRYIFHLKHHKAYKDFSKFYYLKNIDLIHAHTLFSNGYIAYKTFKNKNIPYIITVRGTDVSLFFRYMWHLRQLGINILLNSKKIIFLSHAHKNLVINTYVPKKYKERINNKSTVLPNGIDDYFFDNMGEPKRKTEKDGITILTTAWINKNKNQINVCKAIQKLNNEGYRIKYRIVGGIEVPETNKQLVEYLKSFKFVSLIPRKSKEDLLLEYKQSDVFILVSHKETFGLSYIEALTQCTPIVYSKGQGIDGYFQEGSVGYAASSTSLDDIYDKIKNAINNHDTLSLNASTVIEAFKWPRIAKKLVEIYHCALK